MKTSLSAVKRIGLRFESEGLVKRKPGSNRPKGGVLNPWPASHFFMARDPFSKSKEYNTCLKCQANIDISEICIEPTAVL